MSEIDQILLKVNQIEKEKLDENGFTNFVGNVYNKVAKGQSFAQSEAERAQNALDNQSKQDAALVKEYDMLLKAAPYIDKIVKAKNPNATKAEEYTNVTNEICNGSIAKDAQLQNNTEILTMAKNIRALLNNSAGKGSLNQLLTTILNNAKQVGEGGLTKVITDAKANLVGAANNSAAANNSTAETKPVAENSAAATETTAPNNANNQNTGANNAARLSQPNNGGLNNAAITALKKNKTNIETAIKNSFGNNKFADKYTKAVMDKIFGTSSTPQSAAKGN